MREERREKKEERRAKSEEKREKRQEIRKKKERTCQPDLVPREAVLLPSVPRLATTLLPTENKKERITDKYKK